MPVKPKKQGFSTPSQFTSWSFSRYHDYITCPLKAKLKHLDKIQEPSSKVLDRGNHVHRAAEQFVNGSVKVLGEINHNGEVLRLADLIKEDESPLDTFAEELAALRKKAKTFTEEQWAFTSDYQPCEWFDRNAWCRVIVDVYTMASRSAVVIDYKTGKIRDEQLEQLEVYCMAALWRMPGVQSVTAQFWYLDQGELREFKLTRAELPKMEARWQKKLAPMFNDRAFQPRPTDKCRWCFYRASNKGSGGGQCKY